VVGDLKKRIYRCWEFKKRFGHFEIEEFGLALRNNGALQPLDVTDKEVLSDATVVASLGIKYILDLVLVLGMTPAAQIVTQALPPVPVKTVESQRALQHFSGDTNTMEEHQMTGQQVTYQGRIATSTSTSRSKSRSSNPNSNPNTNPNPI
jgi:hypothetical protein